MAPLAARRPTIAAPVARPKPGPAIVGWAFALPAARAPANSPASTPIAQALDCRDRPAGPGAARIGDDRGRIGRIQTPGPWRRAPAIKGSAASGCGLAAGEVTGLETIDVPAATRASGRSVSDRSDKL
jgi:hypothetical protein